MMNVDVPVVEMDEVYEDGEREEFPPGEFEAEEDGPAPVNTSDEEGGEPAEKKTKSAAKKVVKNPQAKLDDMRLCGPRGIPILPKTFKDVKFKGKGHEVEDLDLYLSKMEHWAHRMFPKMVFDEVIERCDRLYKTKKLVKTTLIRMRTSDNIYGEDEEDDDVAREGDDRGFDDDDDDPANAAILSSTRPLEDPIVSSQTHLPPRPPPQVSTPQISDEMRERIERNKRLALEKRLARMQAEREREANETSTPSNVENAPVPEASPTALRHSALVSDSSTDVTAAPSTSGSLHALPAMVSKTPSATVVPLRQDASEIETPGEEKSAETTLTDASASKQSIDTPSKETEVVAAVEKNDLDEPELDEDELLKLINE